MRYILSKQRQHAERDRDGEEEDGDDDDDRGKPVDWAAVDVVGGSLKMGLN